MRILINNIVTFNSDDGSLFHVDQQDNIIVLPYLASRVLTCLILNAGKIVSRETIFDYVWSKNELLPSNNSLTQYISLIRRSLLELKCQTELIETIPKKGFYLSEEFVIVLASVDNVLKTKGNRACIITLVSLVTLIFISLCILSFRMTQVKNDLNYREVFYLAELATCDIYTVKKVESNNVPVVLERIEQIINDKELNLGCQKGFSYIYQAEDRFFFYGKGREFLSRCAISGKNNENISSCNGVYINAH